MPADDLLMKQCVAVVDKRTTMLCLRVAGQIRPVDEPFETVRGPLDRPPFHDHCRTIVVPWMAGFVSSQRKEANREIRQRPASEKRNSQDGFEGVGDKARGVVKKPVAARVTAPAPSPAEIAARQRWADAASGEAGYLPLYRQQVEHFERQRKFENRMGGEVAREWKSDSYKVINEALHSGRRTGALDGRVFSSVEGFTRAAREVFDELPGTTADVVTARNTSSSFADVKALLTGKPGQVFESPGFSATTSADAADLRRMGLGGDVTMEILIPQGRQVLSIDAGNLSGTNGEMELLLPPGSRFVLAEAPVKEGTRWLVRLVLA